MAGCRLRQADYFRGGRQVASLSYRFDKTLLSQFQVLHMHPMHFTYDFHDVDNRKAQNYH